MHSRYKQTADVGGKKKQRHGSVGHNKEKKRAVTQQQLSDGNKNALHVFL